MSLAFVSSHFFRPVCMFEKHFLITRFQSSGALVATIKQRFLNFLSSPSPAVGHADVFEVGVVDVELDAAEGGDLEWGGAEILAIAS